MLVDEGTISKEKAHLWWHESQGTFSINYRRTVQYGPHSREITAARKSRKRAAAEKPYSSTGVRPRHIFQGSGLAFIAAFNAAVIISVQQRRGHDSQSSTGSEFEEDLYG